LASLLPKKIEKIAKGEKIGRTKLRTLREGDGERGTLLPRVSGHSRSKKTKTFLGFQHLVFSIAYFFNRIAALAWGAQLRESFSRFNFGEVCGRDQRGSH
jgi:hypothetical protein